jgi:hypothetical protein
MPQQHTEAVVDRMQQHTVAAPTVVVVVNRMEAVVVVNRMVVVVNAASW